jgi:tetratricopeptide (TPR) repeat protein
MDVLLEVDGGYIDLELAGHTPVPLERGLRRREEVFQLFRQAFTADTVVITLGLIECWWDTERGKYVHPMPPMKEMTRRKGRFQFKQLRYAEAYDYIRKSVELIEAKGKPGAHILMTTSPVPLSATFTSQDVIIANMYSKSMLRTVAGEIYRNFESVDYFPSFENVMLTRTDAVWAEDLVHVADPFVGKIVDNLLRHYLPEASTDQQTLSRGVALLRMRDYPAAAEIFAKLMPRTARIDALHALARLENGESAALSDLRKAAPKADLQGHECLLIYRRLGKAQAWRESAQVIENALAAGQIGQTEKLDALLRLARMRRRLKDNAGVASALAEAETIAPRRMTVLRSLAQHAMQNGNTEDAVKYLTRIVKSPRFKTLDPEIAKRLRAAKVLQSRKLGETGKLAVDA